MSAARRAIAAAALLGAAACRDPVAPGADEVAAELRAMRLALAARSEGSAGAEALRGQLAGLATAQRATEARQAELQRDLATWMQAVAADAGARRAQEAEQLRLRLDELELALRQQRERQRAMEDALLQGLDRAALRIDGMIDRLAPGGPAPASDPAASPTAPTAAPSAAPIGPPDAPAIKPAGAGPARDAKAAASPPDAPPASGGPRGQMTPGGSGAVPPADPAARPGPAVGAPAQSPRAGGLASSLPGAHLAWFVLAALGAVSACWWIRREVLAARRERREAAAEGVPSDRIADFEQLAAAAAPDAPAASPPATAPRQGDALGVPERLVGAPADTARWLAALAVDPAVLREPPPHAVAGAGVSEVRFWWRPGTSAAARARVRLRLLRPGG